MNTANAISLPAAYLPYALEAIVALISSLSWQKSE